MDYYNSTNMRQISQHAETEGSLFTVTTVCHLWQHPSEIKAQLFIIYPYIVVNVNAGVFLFFVKCNVMINVSIQMWKSSPPLLQL